MVLFAVIDILGSVPIIVSLRKQFGHIDSRKGFYCFWWINDCISFFGDKKNAEIHWYRC